jgi:hypothetical protein
MSGLIAAVCGAVFYVGSFARDDDDLVGIVLAPFGLVAGIMGLLFVITGARLLIDWAGRD